MTNNILFFTGTTSLPLDPDRVLEAAKGKLERVMVIGFEGDNLYVAASEPGIAEAVLLLELSKDHLLSLMKY